MITPAPNVPAIASTPTFTDTEIKPSQTIAANTTTPPTISETLTLPPVSVIATEVPPVKSTPKLANIGNTILWISV
ncbi:hypothetical protein DPMN_182649 [Dreissena polymorpha]|uniref:Uncharacterized protein n=1 Tax=Dreissena polymorpha TaxID=45954 RepID=A0A9D4I2U3_DREPO|nr:hypothetical protein DPMN_182649 [Dreissena polymorpha]